MRLQDNDVRLRPNALGRNLGSLLKRADLPEDTADWLLTSIQSRLIKIGARTVRHALKFTSIGRLCLAAHHLRKDAIAIRTLKPPAEPARRLSGRNLEKAARQMSPLRVKLALRLARTVLRCPICVKVVLRLLLG